MSDASEKFNFDGETNVEDVEGRIKKSAHSIEKQIEGIGNKFKTAFKDIFLSFLGPMALLHLALNYITKAIDERNAKVKEAMDAAVGGENPYVSETTAYLARKQKAEEDDAKQKEQAQISAAETTRKYIEKNSLEVMNKLGVMGWIKYGIATSDYASQQEDVQKAVEELNKDELKKGVPLKSSKDFRSPEGFSNIVGVGANPVLEAMTQQLDEQRRQTELLQKIAEKDAEPIDFTKTAAKLATTFGL